MAKLDKALTTLLDLIGKGWEYPDAHCEAIRLFKVDGEVLRDAYDDYCKRISEGHFCDSCNTKHAGFCE